MGKNTVLFKKYTQARYLYYIRNLSINLFQSVQIKTDTRRIKCVLLLLWACQIFFPELIRVAKIRTNLLKKSSNEIWIFFLKSAEEMYPGNLASLIHFIQLYEIQYNVFPLGLCFAIESCFVQLKLNVSRMDGIGN